MLVKFRVCLPKVITYQAQLLRLFFGLHDTIAFLMFFLPKVAKTINFFIKFIVSDCMLLSCHYAFQGESTLYSCLNVK